MATTPGRLMLESIVPAEFRDHIGPDQDIGSKEIDGILARVADRRPDLYREISHKLLRLGMKGSVETDTSFTLDDLETSLDKTAIRRRVQAEVDAIRGIPDLDEAERNRRILEVYGKYAQELPQMIYDQALGEGSGLARMVAAGARGNKSQLNSSIGMDWAVADSKGRQLPIPIAHGYSEGLTPAEYFAASYGTRLGLVSTKFCCIDTQLVRMADGSERMIRDVRPGDWVLGADTDGRTFPVRVLNNFDNGTRTCRTHRFRVYASNTFVELSATDDHKVLGKFRAWGKEKRHAVDVPTPMPLSRTVSNKARQFVAVPAHGGAEVPGPEDPHAFLVGLLLGNGHCTAAGQVSFSCADQSLLDDVEERMAGLNLRFKKSRPDFPDDPRYAMVFRERPAKAVEERGGRGRAVTGCPFMQRIHGWGWKGKLAHDKVIPDEIDGWSNASVAALVGGLFSTDGTMGAYGARKAVVTIRLTLTSREMVEKVRDLLWSRFGIYGPDIQEVDVSSRKWAKHRQWTFAISHRAATRRFLSEIPLWGAKARQAAELLDLMDGIPSQREDNVFSWHSASDPFEAHTHDLEVDHPDHLFVLSNGLIISNSVQDGGYFCLAGDTLVRTPDRGGVPISELNEGDWVVGATMSGECLPVRVTKVFRNGVRAAFRYVFGCEESRSEVVSTPEHEILWIGDGGGVGTKIPIGSLPSRGLGAASADGPPLAPDSMEPIGDIEVFDIEVDHPDHLYVLDNGMVVSNSKQISAAASDLIVTEDDCGTDNGIPSDPGDRENVGAVLARDAGGVRAGTILTPKVLAEIARANGGKRIVTRSPVSCQAKGGGLCSKCSGVREDNRLPAVGDPVGTNAASGLSMPVQQALLSTKHSAGVISGGGASQVTGFPQIDALAQVPATYPNAATLANLDGKVDSVEPAPQGGTWVTVAGERHYVPQDREIKVKPGDVLEAGDVLSSGTPNPAEIVRHKGVGAGRAYFVKTFLQTLKDNGTTADRRNTEVIARALINHVKIGDEGVSDRYLPDDIAEYSEMARTYVKPEGSRRMKVREARGKYLQAPALHYTIGTRIVPSVERDLEDLDVGEVDVSDDPPPFSPEMVRAMDNPAHKDDLLTHAGQSYVKRNLMADVQSGRAGSDLHGRHIAPAIAKGVELGRPPKGTPGY